MRTGNLIATVMTASMLFVGGGFAQPVDVSREVPSGVQIVVESARIADRQSVRNAVADLAAAGFTYVEIHRTFLGRARLVAYSATEVREVILNPTTGEVLRDLAQENTRDLPEQTNSHANAASENGNKGGNGNNGNAGGGNNGNAGGGNNGNNGNAGGGNRN